MRPGIGGIKRGIKEASLVENISVIMKRGLKVRIYQGITNNVSSPSSFHVPALDVGMSYTCRIQTLELPYNIILFIIVLVLHNLERMD